MTATYWEAGRRIVEYEQEGEARAEYGEALIRRLAENLEPRFGRGLRNNVWCSNKSTKSHYTNPQESYGKVSLRKSQTG